AWQQYKELHGPYAALPAHFVQAADVSAEEQLRMMATVQSCVDSTISRTVRLPPNANAQEVGVVLQRAWALGLKGCAVYREGSRGGQAVRAAPRIERRQPTDPAMDELDLFDQ
ncbi:MAG: hypothetical protein Q7T78_23330, partial [Rhodoferax sp.]|nr:hypothetical protein [Rhodoferax sp.]